MNDKPRMTAGRPSAKLAKEQPKKADKEGVERMNIHFTPENARKLRLYAASKGSRPSAVLNEIVDALVIDI